MEVFREPPPAPSFQPITIVLKTEDEAAYIWHALNRSEFAISDGRDEDYYYPQDNFDKGAMFWALNDAYKPTKEVS